MSFLDLEKKSFLVFGVANRKSVAWAIGKTLEGEGAKVIYSVRSEERKEALSKLLDGRAVYVCDVEDRNQIEHLAEQAGAAHGPFDGLVHSIAYANYSEGFKPFHETLSDNFLQSVNISAFSLVEISRALKPHLQSKASVISIGISSINVTAENYGYMSPVKAALEACTRNLAKSFSADNEIRFNTVNAGPLKTSASAGIPGYLENYLFAEMLTYRKRALQVQEVANTAVFLLSECSSGINGQGIVVNAGMDFNYFDKEVVSLATKPRKKKRPTDAV